MSAAAGGRTTELSALADDLDLPDGSCSRIIEGFLVVQPLRTYREAGIVSMLQGVLSRVEPADPRCLQWVTVEVPPDGDRFVPDLAVLPTAVVDGEGWDGPDRLRSAEDLEPAVEVVSPSSARHDRKAKTKGRARAGVPYYLIIDPPKCEIALFSEPEESTYRTVERAVPGASVSWTEPFGLEVEAAALLQ